MENRAGQRWQKRLEVIMRLEGERLTGFLSNLSNEGLEIRTKARVQVSDEISVRVLTPEGNRYNYLSEVRWWRPAYGRKMGKGIFRYGLRHMAVDPHHDELMEYVRYDPNRRDRQRYDAKVQVELSSMSVHHRAITENISRSGAFLRIDELPPPYRDERLTLSITIDENDKPIIAKARVVHLMQPSWAERLGLAPGIGLHFLELTDEARDKLNTFLETQPLVKDEGDEQARAEDEDSDDENDAGGETDADGDDNA